MSSFVHHFKSIDEFTLESQSGNTQYVKFGKFLSHVTLKFDGWPCKTIGKLFYTTSNFVHHFRAMGEFKLELQSGNSQFGSNRRICVPCDFEIWWMTFKNNRAPLLYYLKLCATFQSHQWIQTGVTAQSHQWIQTGVTARKHPIRVKIGGSFYPYDLEICVHHFVANGEFKLELQSGNAQFGSKSTIFLAVWTWNWTDDLEKQQDTSSKQHQAVCIIGSPYVNSNWSYGPETAKLCFDLCGLDLWPLTFCMDLTSVIGNNSWKFAWWYNDGNIVKKCDRRADRRTDWTIQRAVWSQLKMKLLKCQEKMNTQATSLLWATSVSNFKWIIHMRNCRGDTVVSAGGRDRVTHICVSKLTIIRSDNGLSPGRRKPLSEPMLEYY